MRISNTLTGTKEEFPASDGPVKMYVCGITPYDTAHIGHAMSYILFDVIRRYLEFRGFQVRHVQNFTDVDDKIIARAERLGIPPNELSQRFVDTYLKEMDALNVQRAHVYPKVTEEIPQIIGLVERLIQRGYAYPAGRDVYFRVEKFPDYGKLSHRSLDSMLAGARVEVDESKESPADFALWKAAKPGEPEWESPWGPGRPGWHIECSAMAMRHLGDTIDIHGGGQDLIFPHHENEIAQSEAATGVAPFSRFWLHNGLLRLGEEKMSKSLGNLVTIPEVLEKHTPDALRLFVLTSHYRSPLTYTDEAIEGAERGAERLREAVRRSGDGGDGSVDPEPFAVRFTDAMDDDFGTPQAVAALFDLAREINRGREAGASVQQAQERLKSLAAVLGLTLEDRHTGANSDAGAFIDLLLDIRQELRSQKLYSLSDKIRQDLATLGVTLEDGPGSTTWRRR